MNKETYLKELYRYFNSIRNNGYEDEITDFADCSGVPCKKCMFNEYATCATKYTLDVIESLEKWSNEHPPKNPPKKFKVSRLEYDILRTAIDYTFRDEIFDESYMLTGLLEKGYFNGATSETYVRDYFDNCEVVEK